MTQFRPDYLADKIAANQPLTDEERQQAAEIVRFGEQFKGSLIAAEEFRAATMIVTMWPQQDEDAEDEPTPVSACISLRNPSPERWQAIQALLEDE